MTHPTHFRFWSQARLLLLPVLLSLLQGCTTDASNTATPVSAESPAPGNSNGIRKGVEKVSDFGGHWYRGTAELGRYRLEQARYGEVHEGEAVLIFVTEDFDPEMQVKHNGSGGPKVSVLKLNFSRKFYTGIYPYSIFTSVFSPVESKNPGAIKATASVEEWCGHAYLQVNNRKGNWVVDHHSYFPDEGDKAYTLPVCMLEDEIWTNIRINPDRLPTGDIELVPPLNFIRLMHREVTKEKAKASMRSAQSANGEDLKIYRVEYSTFQRSLEVTFLAKFPFEILSWEEQFPSGFGSKEIQTTRGSRTNSMMLDYWSKNGVADSVYRRQLGLTAQ